MSYLYWVETPSYIYFLLIFTVSESLDWKFLIGSTPVLIKKGGSNTGRAWYFTGGYHLCRLGHIGGSNTGRDWYFTGGYHMCRIGHIGGSNTGRDWYFTGGYHLCGMGHIGGSNTGRDWYFTGGYHLCAMGHCDVYLDQHDDSVSDLNVVGGFQTGHHGLSEAEVPLVTHMPEVLIV